VARFASRTSFHTPVEISSGAISAVRSHAPFANAKKSAQAAASRSM
jgi:hypothetical protein